MEPKLKKPYKSEELNKYYEQLIKDGHNSVDAVRIVDEQQNSVVQEKDINNYYSDEYYIHSNNLYDVYEKAKSGDEKAAIVNRAKNSSIGVYKSRRDNFVKNPDFKQEEQKSYSPNEIFNQKKNETVKKIISETPTTPIIPTTSENTQTQLAEKTNAEKIKEAKISTFAKNEWDKKPFVGADNPDSLAKIVYDRLIQDGFTHEAASAVLGNIITETDNFKSVSAYGDSDDIGILQWSKGRADAFKAYLTANGKSPDDINANVDFMLQEMKNGNEWGIGKDDWGKAKGHSYEDFKKRTGDIGELSTYFMNSYERPAKSEISEANRREHALNIGKKYGTVTADANSNIPGKDITTDPKTGDGSGTPNGGTTPGTSGSGGWGGTAPGTGTGTGTGTGLGTPGAGANPQPNYSFKYADGYSDQLRTNKIAGMTIEAGKFISNAAALARNNATKPPRNILPERVGMNPYIEVNPDFTETNAETARGVAELRANGMTGSYMNSLHRNALAAKNQLISATNNINNQGRISTNQGNSQIEAGNSAAMMDANKYNAGMNAQYAQMKGAANTQLRGALFDNATNALNYDTEEYSKNLVKEEYDNYMGYLGLPVPGQKPQAQTPGATGTDNKSTTATQNTQETNSASGTELKKMASISPQQTMNDELKKRSNAEFLNRSAQLKQIQTAEGFTKDSSASLLTEEQKAKLKKDKNFMAKVNLANKRRNDFSRSKLNANNL